MNLRFPDGTAESYAGTAGGTRPNATEDDLIDALSALENEELEYIILEDDKTNAFLQAAGDTRSGYALEYNDGTDGFQFRATNRNISGDDLTDAFVAYLNHDPSWRTKFTWEKFSF